MNWLSNYKAYKTASSPSNQSEWVENFGDIQRYGMDPCNCSLYRTTTKSKITIAVTLTSNSIGTILWQKFWKYDLSEEEESKKTYNIIKRKLRDAIEDFRGSEIPNGLLWSYLRDSLLNIDDEHLPQTGIPYYNHSQKMKYEKDSRSLLYGKRYPEQGGF